MDFSFSICAIIWSIITDLTTSSKALGFCSLCEQYVLLFVVTYMYLYFPGGVNMPTRSWLASGVGLCMCSALNTVHHYICSILLIITHVLVRYVQPKWVGFGPRHIDQHRHRVVTYLHIFNILIAIQAAQHRLHVDPSHTRNKPPHCLDTVPHTCVSTCTCTCTCTCTVHTGIRHWYTATVMLRLSTPVYQGRDVTCLV